MIGALTVALLLAAGRAHAQETSPVSPRIVVSIADRKLALLDDGGNVIKIYSTAVGARVSPSPRGTFRIATRLARPTYYHPGIVVPPGPRNKASSRF